MIEQIIEPDKGGRIAQHRRTDTLAPQPLLQRVETRRTACTATLHIAPHQQLAIKHRVEREFARHIGKGGGDIIAAATIEPGLPAAADQLHPDAVPFPFGGKVSEIDCAILQRMRPA